MKRREKEDLQGVKEGVTYHSLGVERRPECDPKTLSRPLRTRRE